MTITWHGQSFFEILIKTENEDKDKEKITLVLFPFEKTSSGRPPKIKGDIVVSDDNHKWLKNFLADENAFLITGPGEYGLKGAFIKGTYLPESNACVYAIEAEEMRVVCLDALNQKELSSEEIEELGSIDILMIPIGGGKVIDSKTAVNIINQIEPKVVIPMYYRTEKENKELESVDGFLKLMGSEKPEPLKHFKVKFSALPKEETEIVLLQD